MEQGQKVVQPKDWDYVQRWMLPALAILVLLTALDTLVYYAEQRDRSAQLLSSSLPPDYQRTVSALIASTGNSCPHVCSMSPQPSAPGSTSILVTCGAKADGDACKQPSSYTLRVESAAEPSR